jgi:hypothetical protein
MSGPLKCSLCICLLGSVLLCAAPPAAAEPNNGYPAEIVPLPAGLLVCDTAEDVEAAFEGWRLSFEQGAGETLPEHCRRVAAGLRVKIEFLRQFENDHWTADLLKYFIFREQAPGLSVLVGIYFGYGTAAIKDVAVTTLPPPEAL